MKKYLNKFCILCALITLGSCSKSDFLDKKSSSAIVQPKTIAELQQILNNTATVMNFTGGLAQAGSDDYFVTYADYQTATNTERNAYIWSKDIYAGDVAIPDWNKLYTQVFYANSVLDVLKGASLENQAGGQFTKGWALFIRAFAFYDLTRTFCKPFDETSASSDLGIPLRLSADIDYTLQRSTLKQTFDQILADLNSSLPLLPPERPSANLERPSQIAVYALLARIYLDMRNYTQAEINADKCLSLYDTLIDYNTISSTASNPFTLTNAELIFRSTQVQDFTSLTINTVATKAKVAPDLLNLYGKNDSRKNVYFRLLSDGNYGKKIGYNGIGNYHFTGLATDEVYLIKAECAARSGNIATGMTKLNQLLIKRWNSNATVPAVSFQNLTATTVEEAVSMILLERRKELVWRGLRWQDIKRLNKEGATITLLRMLNGVTYTLPPNDARYIYPIPDDEIAISGLQQNIR